MSSDSDSVPSGVEDDSYDSDSAASTVEDESYDSTSDRSNVSPAAEDVSIDIYAPAADGEEITIFYSDPYQDDNYQYSHIFVPKELAESSIPKDRLMTENEWRGLGIQKSAGWEHYMIYAPERHVVLLRRPLSCVPAKNQ